MRRVTLTPNLKAVLRKVAQRECPEDVAAGRLVSYRVCPICGYAQWSSSQTSPSGFEVALSEEPYYSEQPCYKCVDVMQRAPEIFYWVARAIVFQKDQPTDLPQKA